MLMSKTQKHVGQLLIALGTFGVLASFFLYMHEARPPKVTNNPKSVAVDSAPSSTKLSRQNIISYNVPSLNPKYIAIPAINVSSTPIIKLGLLKSGAIATPDNIYEAGWYDGSSLPGQAGATFIYGHVSSWTANGVFYNLKKLVPGDKVIITKGNNTIDTYRVVTTKIYPYNAVDMNQILLPINKSLPGLNLMTCTGQVIVGTNEFNQRLVVFMELVS